MGVCRIASLLLAAAMASAAPAAAADLPSTTAAATLMLMVLMNEPPSPRPHARRAADVPLVAEVGWCVDRPPVRIVPPPAACPTERARPAATVLASSCRPGSRADALLALATSPPARPAPFGVAPSHDHPR